MNRTITQDGTQNVTQDVTQEDSLDGKIEKAIKDNFNVTTEDLAKQFGVTSMTIKRHLAKMSHIRYVGSGYSGIGKCLIKNKTTVSICDSGSKDLRQSIKCNS